MGRFEAQWRRIYHGVMFVYSSAQFGSIEITLCCFSNQKISPPCDSTSNERLPKSSAHALPVRIIENWNNFKVELVSSLFWSKLSKRLPSFMIQSSASVSSAEIRSSNNIPPHPCPSFPMPIKVATPPMIEPTPKDVSHNRRNSKS